MLERAKILIKEKIKEHKKVLRSSDKDACDVKQRLTQLKKAKDEKLHEAKRLTIEKEFIQNKIKNLNSFPREITKNRQGTNLKPRNFKFLQAQLQKDDNDDEIEVENEIEYEQLQPRNSRWSDFSQHPRLIIDDINSDVEDERTSQL